MSTFRLSRFYIILLSLFLLSAVILLWEKGHAGSFILLNTYHNKILDYFFKYYTNAGDGLFAVFLAFVLFLFIKTQRLSMVLLASYIVSGLLAQLIKRIVNAPRPSAFFTPEQYNKFVDGVHNAAAHSFPSGHSTTAFALAAVLACYTKNKLLQTTYLLLAVLAGYSRIYLGQHFLTDVVSGAVIGTFISIIAIRISEKIPPVKLNIGFKKSKPIHS